jgi:hypothetical protein
MRASLRIVDDFSQVARSLTRHPKFFLFAALILSLGIGMTTALFSLMYGVLLKPLPFPQQNRLVIAWKGDSKDPAYIAELSCPEFRDWQAQAHVLVRWFWARTHANLQFSRVRITWLCQRVQFVT